MMQSLPQIVAAKLGLRPEDIVVKSADTDAAGFDLGVGGGRTTVSLGAASLAAAEDVRAKVLALAQEMLQTPPERLVLAGGRVEIAGLPGSGMTIAEVVALAKRLSGPIAGTGSSTLPGVAAMAGFARGHFFDA